MMVATANVMLCLVLAACHSGSTGPDGIQPNGGEVVVRPDQFGQTITITLAQTLVVRRPAEVEEWNVSYAREVIDLVSPQERKPGPDGWRFRAVAAGETDLAFTAVPPPCPGDTPCPPPAPLQFSLTVRVTR